MEPQTPAPMPPAGDTYSYKGWIISDSFLKRAFAILGYNFVAGLILYIPFMFLTFFMMGRMLSGMAGGGFPQQGLERPVGIPPADAIPTQMMKIDINEICNNAIASMTFESGEATQKFMEECTAGKRQDVIDQYMQQHAPDMQNVPTPPAPGEQPTL